MVNELYMYHIGDVETIRPPHAILIILKFHGPLSTNKLYTMLRELGYRVTRKEVAAYTSSWLKKKGLIIKDEVNNWRLTGKGEKYALNLLDEYLTIPSPTIRELLSRIMNITRE